MRLDIKDDSADHAYYEVFLNGGKLEHCVMADDEAGVALICATDWRTGKVIPNPELPYELETIEVRGKIEIRKIEQKTHDFLSPSPELKAQIERWNVAGQACQPDIWCDPAQLPNGNMVQPVQQFLVIHNLRHPDSKVNFLMDHQTQIGDWLIRDIHIGYSAHLLDQWLTVEADAGLGPMGFKIKNPELEKLYSASGHYVYRLGASTSPTLCAAQIADLKKLIAP